MTTHNPDNERLKRAYLVYLKEAKRQSGPTTDAVAMALSRFEFYTRHRSFRAFHIEQAIGFKRDLEGRISALTGDQLSKATLHATLGHLRRFFQWVSGQPGYKSRVRYSDADYFSLSEKDSRIATAKREKSFPTLEQIRHVLSLMPGESDVERRNRALIAYTILTGGRDSAIASMRLRHVELNEQRVIQDARQVRTKFSKTITTYFFPVGEAIEQIFVAWVRELRDVKLWGDDDPLFPATRIGLDESGQFAVAGLARSHWKDTAPIRDIFRTAFHHADLPYFNPHSFRNTLVQFGEQMSHTTEDFKAWSQNLGHDDVLTTLRSYGQVATRRQGEVIRAMKTTPPKSASVSQRLMDLARELDR